MKTEKVIEHIVEWLKSYAQNAKMDGFVLGISGGVDSAVVSALCAKTGLQTLCVEMPIHQAESQVSRAKEHIDFLKQNHKNVSSTQVDLTTVFEELKVQLPTSENDSALQLSLANSRARLRMTTLYYLAGIHRYLVAGTGNKVEDFGVGFFTKYGDGGVDLSPIGDLIKSEVYKIGKVLNIPNSILEAVPTDGLFGDNRSDEDQLGASYDELEWAMRMKENNQSDTEFSKRQKEVMKIYERLNRANQHKMKPIPICQIPTNLKKT